MIVSSSNPIIIHHLFYSLSGPICCLIVVSVGAVGQHPVLIMLFQTHGLDHKFTMHQIEPITAMDFLRATQYTSLNVIASHVFGSWLPYWELKSQDVINFGIMSVPLTLCKRSRLSGPFLRQAWTSIIVLTPTGWPCMMRECEEDRLCTRLCGNH